MKKLSIFLFLALLSAAGASAQQKFALVIGNGDYTGITRLNNPVNDAQDIASALSDLGFSVETILNGSLDQMENGIARLKNRLSVFRDSYGFLFYAGHGVQYQGENYLIPVDANIQSDSYLRQRAVSVNAMLEEINKAGNVLNVVVLDACRDNPFGWSRGGTRGLSIVANQPADSIIVYATSAGSAAADGMGRNGLFTGHLLNHLRTPYLEVTEVFRRTMGDVAQSSNNAQRPAVYNQFPGIAYLGMAPSGEDAAPPRPASSVPAEPSAHYDGFARIAGGAFVMGSPANERQRQDSEGPQHQVQISPFYIGIYEVTQSEYEALMGANPSRFKGAALPVESVSWFDAVEYCNRRSQREGLTPAYAISGSGNSRTVIWNRSANGYRLPTEAEWEYACRAGTTTPFNTGDSITASQANYNGTRPYNDNPRGEFRRATTPVGSFAPNPWGLYDMHGNVSEWCWDRFGAYPLEQQVNPIGESANPIRVWRGGSWNDDGRYLRSAFRSSLVPQGRFDYIGFRVVRG